MSYLIGSPAAPLLRCLTTVCHLTPQSASLTAACPALVDRVVLVNPATSFNNSLWPVLGPLLPQVRGVRTCSVGRRCGSSNSAADAHSRLSLLCGECLCCRQTTPTRGFPAGAA